MKTKDIFGLAVRLLGLLFLYFGLKAATQMLDPELIENPDKNDVLTILLPVVFDLAIAWWLMRGSLARWAYPEGPKIFEPPRAQEKPAATAPEPAPAPELSGMARAEQKLAALMEKSK